MIPIKQRQSRQLEELVIDKAQAWGFFNRSRQGPVYFPSLDGTLYLLERLTIKYKFGLGEGLDNYVEFTGLRFTIKCVLRKMSINQIFGDSSLVIN